MGVAKMRKWEGQDKGVGMARRGNGKSEIRRMWAWQDREKGVAQ